MKQTLLTETKEGDLYSAFWVAFSQGLFNYNKMLEGVTPEELAMRAKDKILIEEYCKKLDDEDFLIMVDSMVLTAMGVLEKFKEKEDFETIGGVQ